MADRRTVRVHARVSPAVLADWPGRPALPVRGRGLASGVASGRAGAVVPVAAAPTVVRLLSLLRTASLRIGRRLRRSMTLLAAGPGRTARALTGLVPNTPVTLHAEYDGQRTNAVTIEVSPGQVRADVVLRLP